MKEPSRESARLKEASLTIIDEASVHSSLSLRVVHSLLQGAMNDPRPFGGKAIIVGVDFRQTTNVVPRASVSSHFSVIKLAYRLILTTKNIIAIDLNREIRKLIRGSELGLSTNRFGSSG